MIFDPRDARNPPPYRNTDGETRVRIEHDATINPVRNDRDTTRNRMMNDLGRAVDRELDKHYGAKGPRE